MTRPLVLLAAVAAGLLAMLPSGQGGAEPAGGPRSAAVSERPAGTLLFVSDSNRLTAIDVASGRRTTRRVQSVAACGPQMYISGGHVIFAGMRKGRTIVFSVPISLDRRPARLGTAHAFVPSATDGRVWLAGLTCSRRAMAGVREVTVDGRVTRASRRRVPGSWLAGAVHAGLLIQRKRALFVWDAGTGRIVRRLSLAAVTETRGNLLVGCTERSRCRDLAMLDVGSGRTVVARPSSRHELDLGGKLSPDGSLLATPAVADRRWSVALMATSSGATTIVPGSATGRGYPQLSWSSSTGWLFAWADTGRVMAYRPGARRTVPLRVRPPRRAFGFMAG